MSLEDNAPLYQTDSFARIYCLNCGNRSVDVLIPGEPFNSIVPCKCRVDTLLENDGLQDLTIKEMRSILSHKGINYRSKDTKDILLGLLRSENAIRV